jgi:hypothetical protein
MIYRTPTELGEILELGGFCWSDMQLLMEPVKIHCVAICRKV